MRTGISSLACIPVRSEPDERSEMVTQVLFGEKYELIEQNEKFFKIRLVYDKYTGYISKESCTVLSENIQKNYNEPGKQVVASLYTKIYNTKGRSPFIIPAGSEFYLDDNHQCKIGNEIYSIEKNTEFNTDKNVYDIASLFLGSPYLWGGRTFMGIDCSGLVQVVFKMRGINIYRDASQQFDMGITIQFNEAGKGDIAFFRNSNGKIVHVGILDGKGNIIHSSGKVKIEKFTEDGILNTENGNISHLLHSIKRIQNPIAIAGTNN